MQAFLLINISLFIFRKYRIIIKIVLIPPIINDQIQKKKSPSIMVLFITCSFRINDESIHIAVRHIICMVQK